MKTALYIEDGVVQLVLTPETDFEKSALGSFSKKPASVKVLEGQFYDCRGGWTRQKDYYPEYNYYHESQKDQSLILRIEPEPPAATPVGEM